MPRPEMPNWPGAGCTGRNVLMAYTTKFQNKKKNNNEITTIYFSVKISLCVLHQAVSNFAELKLFSGISFHL